MEQKRAALVSDKGKVPAAKRGKLAEEKLALNPAFLSEGVKGQFCSCWKEGRDHVNASSGGRVLGTPFRCCVLPDFVVPSDEGGLQQLREELLKLKFHPKSNDLYQFSQSADLQGCTAPYIRALRDVLTSQGLSLVSAITGIPLTDSVDATCAKYEYTDTLLCHDDQLEGRRVAFIYYLVPPTWSEEDGGTLDLYSTDARQQPDKVVQSLQPKWNSLVFFEVSPISFHRVAEVLSGSQTRLSVAGWFHGPPLEYPATQMEAPVFSPPVPQDVGVLAEWVNPFYLDVGVGTQIREQFEEESQVKLDDFLLEDKYKAVCEALEVAGIKWNQIGPPNKRHLHQADPSFLPPLAAECLQFLQSEPLCFLLTHLTGVELVQGGVAGEGGVSADPSPNDGAVEVTALCNGAVHKMLPGDYTLVHDSDGDTDQHTLDALLYFSAGDWLPECGGFTSYIARDEDEELLTVHPSPNALALVFRDRETLKFLKYVNCRANDRDSPFFTASMMYREQTPVEGP